MTASLRLGAGRVGSHRSLLVSEPAPAHRRAEARLLWSKSALHTRFVGPQNEPLVISTAPQTNVKTLGLWDRDVCEIFIAPDLSDPNSYFEFEGAPTAEWVDPAIRKSAARSGNRLCIRFRMTAAATSPLIKSWLVCGFPGVEGFPNRN